MWKILFWKIPVFNNVKTLSYAEFLNKGGTQKAIQTKYLGWLLNT